MSRLEALNEAVETLLLREERPHQRDFLFDLYQAELRHLRPTSEELDYIDRRFRSELALRRGEAKTTRDLPIYIPERDIIDAFRGSTPMARLYALVNSLGDAWQSDFQDPRKAYFMACFSELAYLHLTDNELVERDRYKIFSPSLVLSELCRHGLRFDLIRIAAQVADVRIEIISVGRFVYVIARFYQFVVVAVRGTVSLRDWKINLSAPWAKAKQGFHHLGFSHEARQALPLLMKALDQSGVIYFTGHSLGAAVASILAQIWPDPRVVRTPYLFASPRFGTARAAKALPRYSYIRPRDVVPHVPPRLLGYSDKGSATNVLPVGSRRLSGLGNLWHAVTRLTVEQHMIEGIRSLLGEQIDEHFPEHAYVDALMSCLKNKPRLQSAN